MLSESERVKAAVLLRLAFSAVGVTLTDKQIEDTFTGAQKAVDELRGDAVYKATFATPTEQPAVAQA